MLEIQASTAKSKNPKLRKSKRQNRGKETNTSWLRRNWGAPDEMVRLLLVGGTSNIALRLRFAQAHARHDLTPSKWSHCLLVSKKERSFSSTPTREVALNPPHGIGDPAATNALQKGELREYSSAREYPNLALIRIPVPSKEVFARCKKFEMQRTVLDLPELVLHWLAYVWGVGSAPNPLLESRGTPAAAMTEFVVNAAGYELTPGLASRSSCPEAIWQAANWWHDYYKKAGVEAPSGAWTATHELAPEG